MATSRSRRTVEGNSPHAWRDLHHRRAERQDEPRDILHAAPYVSWQPVKGQSIGIAPVIAYQRFMGEGLQAFDNPTFSTSPGNVTNNGYSDAWGVGVRVGHMGQFADQIAFGAAHVSKVSMGNFDQYKGLFAQQGGFDIPSNLTVGFAVRPTSSTRIPRSPAASCMRRTTR